MSASKKSEGNYLQINIRATFQQSRIYIFFKDPSLFTLYFKFTFPGVNHILDQPLLKFIVKINNQIFIQNSDCDCF